MATVQNPAGFHHEREKEAIFFQVYNWVLWLLYSSFTRLQKVYCVFCEREKWLDYSRRRRRSRMPFSIQPSAGH